MSPLNHKRNTRSLAPPLIYVAKKLARKSFKDEGSPLKTEAILKGRGGKSEFYDTFKTE